MTPSVLLSQRIQGVKGFLTTTFPSIKGKVLYNLRHTFASRLIMAGINITK